MSSSEESSPVHDIRQLLLSLDSMSRRHELLNREMVDLVVQVQARVDLSRSRSQSHNDVLLVYDTPEGRWRNNDINDATSVVEKMPTAMATTNDDVCSICLVGFQGGAGTPKQPPWPCLPPNLSSNVALQVQILPSLPPHNNVASNSQRTIATSLICDRSINPICSALLPVFLAFFVIEFLFQVQ